jgi:hypothetical protein
LTRELQTPAATVLVHRIHGSPPQYVSATGKKNFWMPCNEVEEPLFVAGLGKPVTGKMLITENIIIIIIIIIKVVVVTCME